MITRTLPHSSLKTQSLLPNARLAKAARRGSCCALRSARESDAADDAKRRHGSLLRAIEMSSPNPGWRQFNSPNSSSPNALSHELSPKNKVRDNSATDAARGASCEFRAARSVHAILDPRSPISGHKPPQSLAASCEPPALPAD
jgi:hypothetical protein